MSEVRNLQDMIHGCIRAERESQKALYKMFYGFSSSICMRYCSAQEDVVEIINDGFLKIFRQIGKFVSHHHDLELSLKSWMKKIFIHTAIDHFRKKQKYRFEDELQLNTADRSDESTDVLDKLSYSEIIRLIQQLSPVYRTVFNLYVIDGFKHDEIALQLGISVGASKSNLFKARMNIQKMIKESAIIRYERKAV